MTREPLMIQSTSQLQEAPRCSLVGCRAFLFLLTGSLVMALCIEYVTTAPWATLPDLGTRRYFYQADGRRYNQSCHDYGTNFFDTARGRAFAVATEEECRLAANSFGINFSVGSQPPCVNGCCIDASRNVILFSNSSRLEPRIDDFAAICTSWNLNLYKMSAIAGIAIAGVALVVCLLILVRLRWQSRILRAAGDHIKNNPDGVFSVEISFGALQRHQDFIESHGCWSDWCAVLSASFASMVACAVVLTVIVTPTCWISAQTIFKYVFFLGFIVGAVLGLLLLAVRFTEKVYGVKARARSLSFMRMHLFCIMPNNTLAREPSVCIVRGDSCHVLRSPGSLPNPIREHSGLTICSSELIKEVDRNPQTPRSLAFTEWALKVECAKVTAEMPVLFRFCERFNRWTLTPSCLFFYFDGDDEASRLHSWLQSTPSFRYRGWPGDPESGGAHRIITLKREARARVVGRLISGTEVLEMDERQDELAGSLRCRLADTLCVHPSKLCLLREGSTMYDRFAIGDVDGIVVSERHEFPVEDAATA